MNRHPATEGPRACRPDELTEMISLANSVMRQGSTQSFLTDYPLVYAAENLPNVQIIKTGDTIVSVVPYIPKRIDYSGARFQIGIISPTATHPEHRRLGHARRCLDSCLSLMETSGIELSVLWTLPTTFPFYEQAGFQGLPPQLDWVHCTKEDAPSFRNHGHSISILDPAAPQQLEIIEALHDNDHRGVIRASSDIQALFTLPRTITYLAHNDTGEVCGYLVYCEGSHKPGILEAEGHPDAVESLVHHVLATGESPNTPIYLTKNGSILSKVARQHLSARILPMDTGPMMVRINKPFEFLTSILAWLESQWQGERNTFSFEIAESQQIIGFDYDPDRARRLILTQNKSEDHRVISRRELGSLIFGSREGNPPFLDPNLILKAPFYFPIPMLDHS